MKKSLFPIVFMLISLLSIPVFSQTDTEAELLGLPGDNLDLYAALDLFQKSKTIEDFEKSLNDEKTGINNLDLNLDEKIDFIKVKTDQIDKDFTFILQVDVTEKETQDVAVIFLSRDKEDKVTLQIVGDKDLYGKDYVIEPKPAAPAVTPNPAYTGADPVTESVEATTVVVVESAPIVTYVYSPVYVPYYPPYYYGFYPPYFVPVAVVAVSVYHHNHYHYHAHYHGGYNNTTVVVHNTNNYNHYNNSRNTSNTVNHNNANGNYNSNRSTAGNVSKPSTSNNNRASTGNVNKPSTSDANRASSGNANRASTSNTNRTSTSQSSRPSNTSTGSGRSGGYSGGSSGGRGGGGRR